MDKIAETVNNNYILNNETEFEDQYEQEPCDVSQNIEMCVQRFVAELNGMGITEDNTDKIFKCLANLMEETRLFCQQTIQQYSEECVPEVIDASIIVVQDKIQCFDSRYKRQQFYESHKSFVKPTQKGIGTHWQNKRDKESKVLLPQHVQSVYPYVPISNKCTSLLLNTKFYSTYTDYNSLKKHECKENVYKDFCCGSKYKENELFKNHPNSLQIQIFIDGFDLCHPLKPKRGIHSQVAVFFAIRNIPPSLAYNLSNIHLVALINANDLKKMEVNYSTLWNEIVKDISHLETVGINLPDGSNIKGT